MMACTHACVQAPLLVIVTAALLVKSLVVVSRRIASERCVSVPCLPKLFCVDSQLPLLSTHHDLLSPTTGALASALYWLRTVAQLAGGVMISKKSQVATCACKVVATLCANLDCLLAK